MVAARLAERSPDRMVLLRPGWERNYEGRPAVYPIGCSGVDDPRRRTARDGRYNLVLRGSNASGLSEEAHEPALPPPPSSRCSSRRSPPGIARRFVFSDRSWSRCCRRSGRISAKGRLVAEARMPARCRTRTSERAGAVPEPGAGSEKQALLEKPCLRTRAESLVELLEMKVMMSRTPGLSTSPTDPAMRAACTTPSREGGRLR